VPKRLLAVVQVPHGEATQLPSSYRNARRPWRHSFHSICSRVASFPPPLTHYFIEAYTKPGDRVLDIFSGTGTAPLQACLDGRIGIGNDISPEAFVLTRAKVDPPGQYDFFAYLHSLKRSMLENAKHLVDKNDLYFGSDFLRDKLDLGLYYHRETLKQLLNLRQVLLADLESPINSKARNAGFCTAIMMGILHGDRPESLSLPLDRSKSLTSNHINKMRKKYPGRYDRRFKDVAQSIARKAEKVYRHGIPLARGEAYQKDAAGFSLRDPVNLVITSPPYFSAHTYAYDNRHRLWFLGYDYRKVQDEMFQTSNQGAYFDYILKCLKNIQGMLSDDSACVLVVGDVGMTSRKDRTNVKTGEEIAMKWADSRNTEMEVSEIIVDPIPLKSRRYIHVPVTQGIKQERLVIFHKGKPSFMAGKIDWTVHPRVVEGPKWTRFYQ